jgi:hypothetical protein
MTKIERIKQESNTEGKKRIDLKKIKEKRVE